MPELINKYRVFLASPSDVLEEREAIVEVISELNIAYGNRNNLIIELVKWETHSAPGVSKYYAQDLINSDIGIYDIFIGIIWKKFGTPTENFGSGTEEEFSIAYERFKANPNSIQILFYFKNALVSIDDIDWEQLMKIKNFKSSLGQENVFYWDFSAIEDLQRFLRIHIPIRIETLKKAIETSVLIDDNIVETEAIGNFDELGSLDYLELFEENMSVSELSLNRMSEATAWIGNEFKKHADEIEILVKSNNNQGISRKVQRNIYDKTARVMDDYANRIDPEIVIYINAFENSIDSFSKLVLIYQTDYQNNESEISEAKVSLGNLLIQISGAIDSMNGFLDSLVNLPRVTKEFNKAKNNAITKLQSFVDKLEVSLSLATELYKSMPD